MAQQGELRRLHVIEKVLEGIIKKVEAAEILSLIGRQIRRVVKRIRSEGSRGIIQAVEVLAAPVGRNVAEILRQLRALQHHQATGEFMPCGWEPGKPTLAKEGDAPSIPGKVWEVWKPRNAF